MTQPALVRDTNNSPVQALAPLSTVSITLSGSSTRATLPSDTRLVRLASDVPCFVAFGNGSVTASASSMLFPAGVEVFTCESEEITHVAALLSGATPGTLSITKMV